MDSIISTNTFSLQKGLPQCIAGYETWIIHHWSRFTGATLIEMGVYRDAYMELQYYTDHTKTALGQKDQQLPNGRPPPLASSVV